MLEKADGGTVVLEQVEELSATAQAALSRLLDTKRFRRVGGASEKPINVRIIATTTQDLKRSRKRGTFDPGLYKRLAEARISLLPLRQRADEIMHGKMSLIHHDGKGVFHGLPNPFPAIRYHSLAVVPQSVPDCLEVTAWTPNGIVMGLRHRRYPVEGVQFHPESIMTEVGKDLLRNFLNRRCKHD